MPDITAWDRLREESQEFEATLCYVVRVPVKKELLSYFKLKLMLVFLYKCA